jgi:transposase InsO family protein
MVSFIDRYRGEYGVEPICAVLPIASSTYHEQKARQRDPGRAPDRAKQDIVVRGHIRRLWLANRLLYGVRKIWRAMKREGLEVARCTVARLMQQMGFRGAVRGRKVRTTIADSSTICPLDLVSRDFTATRPNQLWVADFTYVATWSGFVYTSFVVDVFARRIVGWRVASSMHTDLVLDALEQAIWARDIAARLVHHSDRGSQYLSIHYAERLVEAGIDPSVGSVGDSYDNAMAESV